MVDQKDWKACAFTIHYDCAETRNIIVGGRNRWALEELMAAGERGCTPIDNPAPRWSGYTHVLRDMGVPIETIAERHGGPFAGTHARYVLRATVTRNEGQDA